jgi:RimJ/RimL family protein N-acetyltransferase
VSSLVDLWPLYGLVIETPRLRLQLPPEHDLVALARAAQAIQPAGQPAFQLPWMYAPSPYMERALLQRHWRALAHWRPESWHLLLAIYSDGRPIGVQELWATDYRVTRAAGTGSWLSLAYQGRGLGSEALAAVLALAFGRLGAEEVHLEYLDGNLAAAAVAARLGSARLRAQRAALRPARRPSTADRAPPAARAERLGDAGTAGERSARTRRQPATVRCVAPHPRLPGRGGRHVARVAEAESRADRDDTIQPERSHEPNMTIG